MSEGQAIPLQRAQYIASILQAAIAPYCVKVTTAGSIRRQIEEVHDIEIVALPATIQRKQAQQELFDEEPQTEKEVLLEAHLESILIANGFEPGERWGPRYKKIIHISSGTAIDLFTVPDRAEWGILLTIRTGPAEFGKNIMQLANKLGFHVTGNRLHKHPKVNIAEEGEEADYKPCSLKGDCPDIIDTNTEEEFFNALGLSYIAPKDRKSQDLYHLVQEDIKGYDR